MCELFAMSCSQPATVNYSLKEFALHGGSTYKNNSGWGIAFFQGKEPRKAFPQIALSPMSGWPQSANQCWRTRTLSAVRWGGACMSSRIMAR